MPFIPPNRPTPTNNNPKSEPKPFTEPPSKHHAESERTSINHYKITGNDSLPVTQTERSASGSASQTGEKKEEDTINVIANLSLSEQSVNHSKTFRQLAEKGDTPGLIKHMSQHASKIDINGISSNGNTALHWAAMRNHLAVIKTLLDYKGLDINIRNKNGKSAAMLAPDQSTAVLIKLAAQENQQKSPSNADGHFFASPRTLFIDETSSYYKPEPSGPGFFSAICHESKIILYISEMNIDTMKSRDKIAKDFQAILQQLVPSIPENGQVIELACGACVSALRYQYIYGSGVKFFGIDQGDWNIQESERYAARLKSMGIELSFYLGDPRKRNEFWPEKADLCVIRHPEPVPSEIQTWKEIFNAARSFASPL